LDSERAPVHDLQHGISKVTPMLALGRVSASPRQCATMLLTPAYDRLFAAGLGARDKVHNVTRRSWMHLIENDGKRTP